MALVPLVMVAMNLIYALSAYPFGKLSDRMSHRQLLAIGLVILIVADLVLATNDNWGVLIAGVALWGIHLGMTQGLLARMVADSAPADLRGTAYGFFNLMSGIALLIASAVAGLLWTGIYVLCGSRVLCYYACGSSLATNSRKIKTVTVS